MPDQSRDSLLRELLARWDDPITKDDTRVSKVPTLTESEKNTINTPGGPVYTPPPPQYQPYPLVIGHELGKMVDNYLKFAPGLQSRVTKVQYGPTPKVMRVISNDTFPDAKHYGPFDFERTNLLGLSGPLTGDIALNPRLSSERNGPPPAQILGHELTHVAGYLPQTEPEHVEEILKKLNFNVKR